MKTEHFTYGLDGIDEATAKKISNALMDLNYSGVSLSLIEYIPSEQKYIISFAGPNIDNAKASIKDTITSQAKKELDTQRALESGDKIRTAEEIKVIKTSRLVRK